MLKELLKWETILSLETIFAVFLICTALIYTSLSKCTIIKDLNMVL